MDIARAAAGLFVTHGLRATRAEDIARAAGVAPRTFYRYFATKEEALGPLFAAGAQKWAEAVRDAPAELDVPEALRHAVAGTLTPGVGVRAESLEWVRTLLRLADGSPALRRVWGEACQTAERTLADVLAARLAPPGTSAPADAGESAVSGSAAGPSAEEAAITGAPATPGAEDSGVTASPATPGAGGSAVTGAPPPPGAAHGIPADLRLAAAVASAAVRVAVEVWAAGEEPPDGPTGPPALALRNLATLDDFPWSAVRV
ncbi:TetR family transcriptional regulator [Streptomyces sp. NPDC086783]|uniref:TetR/AcrR family transcriptional regulator n=1 Tax=Streptomyces sp. NPDC086783 TaxID=3365758 RepID=UPI00381B80FC